MANAALKVFEALKAAGVPEDDATEALVEHSGGADDRINQLDRRLVALDGRVTLLSWMVGVNIALSLIVLGKLFTV